ncbi:serine proteinase stubble isoform X2 [Drosophila busckii]|uniref:serine proteinase stubble isoform X2 n=1 Tax=Drosophila busckii TaxID=30019 RepID=UPI00083EF78E|nr:serine proteinase stubble isoform X2 [Drosophila busckii]XP_017849066.1 serine proteinase stubble isoform X2 [Drosophila busckii]
MKQATLIRHRHSAVLKMWPKRHWLVNRAVAALTAWSTHQIVEVLVALILVNCLKSSSSSSSSSSGSSSSLENESTALADFGSASLPSFYRSPHRLDGYYTPAELQRSQNFKISPKPCSFGRVEGTCMFVWECIKSEGQHVGMCVDSFMFGSCCAHNYTDNIVVPQTAFSYTRPTKPLSPRPRPPAQPYKPLISGMTTIERPHGAGTLVIRPSGPIHQGALSRPHPKPTAHPSPSSPSDLQSAASQGQSQAATAGPNSIWHTSTSVQQQQQQQQQQHHHQQQQHQQHLWHMTTEPSFITKPRPTGWTKPGNVNLPAPAMHQRPSKPPKPTKKPIVYERPTLTLTSPPTPSASPMPASTTMILLGQTKPKPKPKPTRPQLSPVTSLATSTATKGTTTTTTTVGTTRKPTKPYQRPSASTTTTTITTKIPTKTTTRPQPSSSISSSSSQRPTATQPTRPSQIQQSATAGIESNEITDSSTHEAMAGSSALGHVKTISAARSECGVPMLTRPETRIVGGKSAAFGRWPWQVSVRRTSFFGFSSTHRCGGALINENWIATAGHCVDDLLISQIRIRVGEYDFSHVQEQLPYIERAVSKKVVHPKYNFFTYEYDLALVKLEQPLEFAPHVSPICLPETESLLIGMNATVTGWGRLSEGGTLPSVLQEVSVPIVSNDNCKSMFLRAGRQEFIPDIFLCAGYETGGQDSCQGDSGGPLQAKSQDGRFFLAGIISWGIGCAEANLPGVCTRISKFVPWILEHVR